jgi:replication factor C large subunit
LVSWTHKHAPKRRSEVVGNQDSVNAIIAYLNRFRNPQLRSKLVKKAILLVGPPGIGKTSSVLAIANGLNFDVVMVNASDKRNKNSLKSVKNASIFSSLQEQLDSKVIGQILLIDEVDGLSGTADRGGIKEIIDIIKSTRVPIILTANNVSHQKFSTLKKYCELNEFLPPAPKEILKILSRISEKESIDVSDDVLLKMIKISQNDIRGSINSLQALATGKTTIDMEDLKLLTYRDQTIEIREFLRTIFIEADGEKAYQQSRLLTDVDYGKLLLILRDFTASFIPKNDYDQLAKAYNLLAKADEVLTRARRYGKWSQISYFYNFCTRGLVSIINPGTRMPNFPDWQLQIPSYWITLSRQKKGLRIAEKISKICMVSKNEAIYYYFPYLRFIFNHNSELASHLALEFNLFDIEPGKRKTKLLWNGEIDYFSKNKSINREVKKRIRELYPKLGRIKEKEIDPQVLRRIQENQMLMLQESKLNSAKSKRSRKKDVNDSKNIKNNKEMDKNTIEKTPEKRLDKYTRSPSKKKSKNSSSGGKTLSDFL